MDASTPTSSGRSGVPAPLRRAVVTAGAVVLLAHVVVLWTMPFHSQDGPAHMFATVAWQRLLTGDDGTLADIYMVNTAPDPNWITYPVLSVLLQVGTVRQAELLMVTVLAVGTAAALHYAVTARGRGSAAVAVAGFAVCVGWSLHTGLYNFTASVALLLVIIGYAIRMDGRVNLRSGLVLAGMTLLLYFSHPLSLTVAYLTAGALMLSDAIADARARRSWRPLWVRGAALLAVAAPSAVLLLTYLADPGSVAPRATPRRIGESLISTMLMRWPLQVTRGDVGWITGLAVAVWVVVVALVVRRVRHRDWNRWDVLLIVALVTGGGAVVLPDRLAGGSLVQPRLAIYAVVALLLWIGVANADVGLAHLLGAGLGVVGVVVMVGLLVARAGPYREISMAVDEVVGVAEAVPAGSTMLGAVSSRAPHMSPVIPLVHITDMVAVAADAVPVATLDAGSGYGPITYRERFDPDPALRGYPRSRTHGSQVSPTRFRNVARRYAATTGEPLDYIVLVDYRLSPEDHQEFTAMGFRLVRRTPTGLAHLYQVTPRVLASVSEPVGGDRWVLASVSEPVGGDRWVLASVSEPVGTGRS